VCVCVCVSISVFKYNKRGSRKFKTKKEI